MKIERSRRRKILKEINAPELAYSLTSTAAGCKLKRIALPAGYAKFAVCCVFTAKATGFAKPPK
jgi:hypothetical protein